MCVRLDRRAVYLGRPGAHQRCPADAVGRRRAILIDPRARRGPRRRPAPAAPTSVGGSDDYTGLGFDACTAPSSRTMAAWAASPYRAIGVYIGGLNRACSQPNLTSSLGLRTGRRGLAPDPHLRRPAVADQRLHQLRQAQPQLGDRAGAEAASDAVADAQSIGMGPGSPIYYDMETYTRTSSATAATLTFLAAWTDAAARARLRLRRLQLQRLGHRRPRRADRRAPTRCPTTSGIANWNGAKNTLDPYVPATAWVRTSASTSTAAATTRPTAATTINIDNNYVEGATVGGHGTAAPVLPPLTVKNVRTGGGTVRVWVRCGWSEGETCPGRIILRTHARLPLRARPGVPTRVVRIGVGNRTFRLAGGSSHTFRLALNSRGRPLLRQRGLLKTQLLVAIPGARATRAVQLSLAR